VTRTVIVELAFIAISVLAACATGAPRVRAAKDVLHPYGDGCRSVERSVAHDESFERWPSPDRIADGLDGVYVGRSLRGGGAIPRPLRVEMAIEVDRNGFVVREIVSRNRPQERSICHSNMLVPMTIVLRVGRHSTRLRLTSVTYSGEISATARLPEAFVRTFTTEHTGKQRFHISIPTYGNEVFGSFVDDSRGVVAMPHSNVRARRRGPLRAPQ
jgi:hypothetical protein